MEEKMKIHDKIHDLTTNLGKNPLLTLLLHVSLSRNALSLSKNREKKNQKQSMDSLEREEKSIYIGTICARSLKRAEVASSERLKILPLAIEKLPRSLILLRSLKQADLVLSGTCSLKGVVVA